VQQITMRIFHCGHCDQLIFFENIFCGKCGHKLAYLPDQQMMASLDPARGHASNGDGSLAGLWSPLIAAASGRTYRLCRHYTDYHVCNWAIPSEDPNELCSSCRLTRMIPDLTEQKNQDALRRLETAKRRLVYSLMEFDLPVVPKSVEAGSGLEFRFMADPPGGPRVLTGHDNGVITVNIAEADDVERERARVSMHEPYRTLLGHFRHEIGHYYWDRLVKDSPHLDEFRQRFGDERIDYNQALQTYYKNGPASDWPEHFVSSYASVHPWEDWAETWAHYLHMTDALETAAACGLSMQPDRYNEPVMTKLAVKPARKLSFDELIGNWFALTYVHNNLNRGMGLADAYPFVLAGPTIDKIRFIYDVVRQEAGTPKQAPAPAHACG
jgi:hypothetical protein